MAAELLRAEIVRRIVEISRLTRGLRKTIEARREDKYVPHSVKAFVEYFAKSSNVISDQCKGIRDASAALDDEKALRAYLRQLDVFQEHLCILHFFLKDVLDISVLHSPSSFLLLLQKTLGECLPAGGFIAARGQQYNYAFRGIYRLAETIPDDRMASLALLTYPFVETSNVLGNVLLTHEVGHFVYRKASLQGSVQNAIGPALSEYEEEVKHHVGRHSDFALSPEVNDVLAAEMWTKIHSWWEECFADFFAVRVAGPAYLLAFWLYYHVQPGRNVELFSEKHPAQLYRIARLLGALDHDGWQAILEANAPETRRFCSDRSVLVPLSQPLRQGHFRFSGEPFGGACYKYLDPVVERIFGVASATTKAVALTPENFLQHHSAVISALQELVPPSIVWLGGAQVTPPPWASINSAFFFYFTDGLNAWGARSDRPASLETEHFFFDRLNDLLLKAIEDWLVRGAW